MKQKEEEKEELRERLKKEEALYNDVSKWEYKQAYHPITQYGRKEEPNKHNFDTAHLGPLD